jgi:4-hydroxybenzoate polyprenyltransferase
MRNVFRNLKLPKFSLEADDLRALAKRSRERKLWLAQHAAVAIARGGAYLRLVRLHRPIGIWLLLWPTLWAIWIAADGRPSGKLLLIFVVGTIVMRSAGCIINDFADRKIDRHVARTRERPLATGEVSIVGAFVAFIGLMTLGLLLVLSLNRLTQLLAIVGALLTLVYPFAKRFISAPQFVLGVAFSWGVPMAFAAELGEVPRLGWLLFIVTMVWVVIYDTEYAMTDRPDDLKLGVKSTAILFGDLDRAFIGGLQLMLLLGLYLVGHSADRGGWYVAGLGAAGIFMLYQQHLIRGREPQRCFEAFENNAWLGVAVFTGLVLDYVLLS